MILQPSIPRMECQDVKQGMHLKFCDFDDLEHQAATSSKILTSHHAVAHVYPEATHVSVWGSLLDHLDNSLLRIMATSHRTRAAESCRTCTSKLDRLRCRLA
jgi:hypothetical protein